ncbi:MULTISPECIES: hypothetical protein [Nostocales]|nr:MULTISPECIES: hypothetical protein [Nostocales]
MLKIVVVVNGDRAQFLAISGLVLTDLFFLLLNNSNVVSYN